MPASVLPLSHFLFVPFKRPGVADVDKPICDSARRRGAQNIAPCILAGIQELAERRERVTAVSNERVDAEGKDVFVRYFHALAALETAFPQCRQDTRRAFSWTLTANPRKVVKQKNIQYEKASVLFNLAAYLSQDAIKKHADRTSESLAASHAFQESAAVFAYIRRSFMASLHAKAWDLSTDFLWMAEKMMMAQAQECIVWRALQDQRSSLVIARLAKHAVQLYLEALYYLKNSKVSAPLFTTWRRTMKQKASLLEAICQFQASQCHRENEEIATEIVRLEKTLEMVDKSSKKKQIRHIEYTAFVHNLEATAIERLRNAKGENGTVYLQRVLPFEQLPLIMGYQVARLSDCTYLDDQNETLFNNSTRQ